MAMKVRGLCKCGHPRGEHPLMRDGYCCASGCNCRGFDEAAPDPLEVAERAADHEMRDPGIDALGEMVRLLNGLDDVDRQAALAYLTSRYAGPL